jgi:hypothetical protein
MTGLTKIFWPKKREVFYIDINDRIKHSEKAQHTNYSGTFLWWFTGLCQLQMD